MYLTEFDRSRAVLQGDPAFIEHSVPQFGRLDLFLLSTTVMSRPFAVISNVLEPTFILAVTVMGWAGAHGTFGMREHAGVLLLLLAIPLPARAEDIGGVQVTPAEKSACGPDVIS